MCAYGFSLLEIGVRCSGGQYEDIMRMDQPIEIVMRYALTREYKQLHLTLHFKNDEGQIIFSCCGGGRCYDLYHAAGEYEQICHIPANTLNWGTYALDLYAVVNRAYSFARETDIVSFTISNKACEMGTFMGKEPGYVTPQFEFEERVL